MVVDVAKPADVGSPTERALIRDPGCGGASNDVALADATLPLGVLIRDVDGDTFVGRADVDAAVAPVASPAVITAADDALRCARAPLVDALRPVYRRDALRCNMDPLRTNIDIAWVRDCLGTSCGQNRPAPGQGHRDQDLLDRIHK